MSQLPSQDLHTVHIVSQVIIKMIDSVVSVESVQRRCKKRQWRRRRRQIENQRGRSLFDRGMQMGHAVTRRRLYLARVQPNRRSWKKRTARRQKVQAYGGAVAVVDCR